MSIADLVPIMFPALLIIGAAVWLVSRERSERDVVLDLRDVPVVRLAEVERDTVRSVPAPLSGRLVEPRDAGTLGARLRVFEPLPDEEPEHAVTEPHGSGRVIVRRRTQPLVAVSRAQAS